MPSDRVTVAQALAELDAFENASVPAITDPRATLAGIGQLVLAETIRRAATTADAIDACVTPASPPAAEVGA